MCKSFFLKISGSIPSVSARDLTRLKAACALSFITSPSWPVRSNLPSPGIFVASINKMSPPNGVQAKPVATPGKLVRSAISLKKFLRTQVGGERLL